MNRAIGTVLAACVLSACATARTSNITAPTITTRTVVDGTAKARIDSTLRAFVSDGKIAGVSALVYEKGEEVYFNAFGMADREANRPMKRDAIVQIFSMTKPVTGVALM
jgi:CubicO group peptidase (beta-lactamase class C family)